MRIFDRIFELMFERSKKGKPNKQCANETSKGEFPLEAAIGCGVILAVIVVVVVIIVVEYLGFISTR